MTKKNIAFFCIALLLTCTAVCTSAETFFFYVSANGEFSSDAITLTRSSGNYYLFLPGQLRPDLLKVAYIGTQDEVLLNGTVLQQDTSAAVLQHENLLEYRTCAWILARKRRFRHAQEHYSSTNEISLNRARAQAPAR